MGVVLDDDERNDEGVVDGNLPEGEVNTGEGEGEGEGGRKEELEGKGVDSN